jgi:TPR repeat protein
MIFITLLKKPLQLTRLALVMSVMVICSASATNAFKGDDFYQQENFKQALSAYMAAVDMGSPHVYYQLGTIYYKGLGTKPNYLSALLWFSLAAEYEFSDAEKVFNLLIKNIDEKTKANIHTLINDFKKKYGKQQIQDKYLPELITANLNKKVTFGGKGTLNTQSDEADKLFGIQSTASLPEIDTDDDYDNGFNNYFGSPFDGFNDDENEISNDEFGDIQGASIQKRNPLDLPYLAVIDYEIAADGSIRSITKEYAKGRAGNIKTALYDFSLYTRSKPTFSGERVNFIHREYLGLAKWGLGRIRAKHKDLYDWVRRENKKLSKQNTNQSHFKQAMLLTYYPWFPQEKGFAVSLLKKVAEQGYVYAQYEYGLYLYRKQKDPAKAIEFLSLASQFGLSKAQYALARILQNSPWVVADERKALYWYENSAKGAHPYALLRAAELKLLASDESLRDQTAAIDILKNIEQTQRDNPEYSYLVAISHLKGEHRDFPKVVRYLRKAISRGHTLNWDVSKWEEQLARWTTGTVTIHD